MEQVINIQICKFTAYKSKNILQKKDYTSSLHIKKNHLQSKSSVDVRSFFGLL